MASVLLCEDERLGREVAVKRLHADSPVDVEQRFAREAKLGASLNHPNLVSVFDTATDDEGVLIVMEYVEGEPLSRMLRRGPLRPEEVASMVRDLGDALDHAHSQGVVHRDVKPANVLIRGDGVTKLADLGIATASDGTRITRSGTVLGTASYMAPEQLDGRGAGPPADVYALAAISFEALSGKRPREGRTPLEIAHKIATEGAPDLLDAWPGAPPEAARALKRGMAFDPEDRPASAGEFARELAGALEAAGAPETTRRQKTAKTRRLGGGRRSKRAAGAAGAAAAAAGAGAAAGQAAAGPGAAEQAAPDRAASGRAAERAAAAPGGAAPAADPDATPRNAPPAYSASPPTQPPHSGRTHRGGRGRPRAGAIALAGRRPRGPARSSAGSAARARARGEAGAPAAPRPPPGAGRGAEVRRGVHHHDAGAERRQPLALPHRLGRRLLRVVAAGHRHDHVWSERLELGPLRGARLLAGLSSRSTPPASSIICGTQWPPM